MRGLIGLEIRSHASHIPDATPRDLGSAIQDLTFDVLALLAPERDRDLPRLKEGIRHDVQGILPQGALRLPVGDGHIDALLTKALHFLIVAGRLGHHGVPQIARLAQGRPKTFFLGLLGSGLSRLTICLEFCGSLLQF